MSSISFIHGECLVRGGRHGSVLVELPGDPDLQASFVAVLHPLIGLIAAERRLVAVADEIPAREPPPIRPADLIAALYRASDLEALAEVRDRLLGILETPEQLCRVHIENVAGGAPKCRLSLELSDAGGHLAAALGAGDVDRLVVEKALGHFNLSVGLHAGDDAESPAGATSPTTECPEVLRPEAGQ